MDAGDVHSWGFYMSAPSSGKIDAETKEYVKRPGVNVKNLHGIQAAAKKGQISSALYNLFCVFF